MNWRQFKDSLGDKFDHFSSNGKYFRHRIQRIRGQNLGKTKLNSVNSTKTFFLSFRKNSNAAIKEIINGFPINFPRTYVSRFPKTTEERIQHSTFNL